MKGFKKLALATAVAALPMSGFAMEALDDASLSDVTGQDGITIQMGATGAFDIRIDDNDGLPSVTDTGAIYIDNFDTGAGGTTIVIDADADTLQAAITLGAGTIDLGAVSPVAMGATAPGTTVLDFGTLTHTGITVNVQLGVEDQGHFAVLTGTVTGGINLDEFTINDINSTGAIVTDVLVNDAGAGTDLTLSGNINVTPTGMTIAGLPTVDVTLGDFRLGSAAGAHIGDINIIGLTTPTVTISGHTSP